VILAGVLLKLGTYGFLRFSFPLFPAATFYFTPLMLTLASVGVVYTSLTAIRQTDVKRVVAYASIAHMNVVLIGMFSLNTQGIEGSIFQMLSHGIVAAALFFSIGVMYDRYHSRLIKYYSGLVFTMPIFMTFFLLFTMGNIALPGTSSFVGEFLILAGIIQTNYVATFIGASGMVLGGAYSLWLFNRVAFGNLKTQYVFRFSDMNRREFSYFFPLLFLMILLGLYPDLFLEPMHLSVSLLIEHIHLNS
jgi:proton-translocating NADH-quinone oxidoreductase chain M